MGITPVSINRKADKQIVVYTYSGILLSNKKQTMDTYNCMDRSKNYYAEWKKPDQKKSIYCMSPFIENSRKCKLIYNDKTDQ